MDRREAIGAMIGLAASPLLADHPAESCCVGSDDWKDWTPAMVNAPGFGFDVPTGSSIDAVYAYTIGEDGFVVPGSVERIA